MLRQMILMDDELREEQYRSGSCEARTILKSVLSEKIIFRSILFGLSTLVRMDFIGYDNTSIFYRNRKYNMTVSFSAVRNLSNFV